MSRVIGESYNLSDGIFLIEGHAARRIQFSEFSGMVLVIFDFSHKPKAWILELSQVLSTPYKTKELDLITEILHACIGWQDLSCHLRQSLTTQLLEYYQTSFLQISLLSQNKPQVWFWSRLNLVKSWESALLLLKLRIKANLERLKHQTQMVMISTISTHSRSML